MASYNDTMKELCGDDIVALAASLAVKLSEDADFEELCTMIELLGLLKHNLEVIKCRKIIKKKRKFTDQSDDD